MFTYGNSTVNYIEYKTDFNEIWEISLDQMGTLHFIKLSFKGKTLPRNSDECAETNGDCLEFVEKYLNI